MLDLAQWIKKEHLCFFCSGKSYIGSLFKIMFNSSGSKNTVFLLVAAGPVPWFSIKMWC